MARTTTPCPECGELDPYRQAGTVCHNCRRAIKAWNSYKTELESSLSDKEMTGIYIPESYHSIPYLYIHNSSPETEELRNLLPEALRNICIALSKEVIDASEMQQGDDPVFPFRRKEYDFPVGDDRQFYSNTGTKLGIISKYNLKLLQDLWTYTALFGYFNYLGGLAEGKNLLLKLADGTYSTQDFQERDLKMAEQVQKAREMAGKYLPGGRNEETKRKAKSSRTKPAKHTD